MIGPGTFHKIAKSDIKSQSLALQAQTDGWDYACLSQADLQHVWIPGCVGSSILLYAAEDDAHCSIRESEAPSIEVNHLLYNGADIFFTISDKRDLVSPKEQHFSLLLARHIVKAKNGYSCCIRQDMDDTIAANVSHQERPDRLVYLAVQSSQVQWTASAGISAAPQAEL